MPTTRALDVPASGAAGGTSRLAGLLAQTGGFCHHLFDALEEAVIITDAAGIVHHWSRAARELYGWEADEVLGRDIVQVTVPRTSAKQAIEIMDSLRTGRRWSGRFTVQRRDGSAFLAVVSNSPVLDQDGTLVGIIGTSVDITEQARTADALAASEERLRSVMEHSQDVVVVINEAGTIEFVSRSALGVLGYDPGDLLGQSAFDLVHPDDMPRVLEAVERAGADRGSVQRVEYRVRHADQSWRVHEALGTSMDDTSGGVARFTINARDVTERKQDEEQLRLLSRALEQSPASVTITDPSGNIVYVNPKFCEVTGYEPREVVGRTPRVLKSGHHSPEFYTDLWRTISAGHEWRGEVRNRRKNGEHYWDLVLITPVHDESGGVTHFLRIGENLTERKHLEDQLRQAQKMEAIGQLAGGIAHDFNNILTAIIAYSEMLLGDLRPADPARADVAEIRSSAERAAKLTRQLLAFGRRQVLQPATLDLRDTVTGLESMLHRLIGEHIELDVRLAPDVQPVLADPGQLEQVIMNLAINARDAMPRGGRLTIAVGRDDPDGARRAGSLGGPHVVLTVTDTGEGMDEKTLDHIFEPFFTTKDPGKGTGLGLSTVYGIVRQSNGVIDVESTPGAGTTFRILLPRDNGTAEAGGTRSASSGFVAGGSETVLLVEDEEAVRAVGRRILQKFGYTVIEAANGAEALAILERRPGAVDLVVSDLIMPVLGGHELTERIASMESTLPVLITSGYTEVEILRQGSLRPGTRFLGKPFTVEALTRSVREMLDRKPDAGHERATG